MRLQTWAALDLLMIKINDFLENPLNKFVVWFLAISLWVTKRWFWKAYHIQLLWTFDREKRTEIFIIRREFYMMIHWSIIAIKITVFKSLTTITCFQFFWTMDNFSKTSHLGFRFDGPFSKRGWISQFQEAGDDSCCGNVAWFLSMYVCVANVMSVIAAEFYIPQI